jgi:ABC-type microcin C transport system duplicated ATPase subunit YejF
MDMFDTASTLQLSGGRRKRRIIRMFLVEAPDLLQKFALARTIQDTP